MGLAHLLPTVHTMASDIELQFKNKECKLYIADVVRNTPRLGSGSAFLTIAQTWASNGLPSGITHDQVVDRITSYWNHRFNKVILSIVKGLSDQCTHNVGPVFDSAVINTAKTLLQASDVVMVMHSKQYSWFLNNTIVGKTPAGFSEILGQRTICDDRWHLRETLVMSGSAFEFQWIHNNPHPIELDRTPFNESITSRVEWGIRPLGWSFIGPINPTNADLAISRNWRRVHTEPSGIVVLKP